MQDAQIPVSDLTAILVDSAADDAEKESQREKHTRGVQALGVHAIYGVEAERNARDSGWFECQATKTTKQYEKLRA